MPLFPSSELFPSGGVYPGGEEGLGYQPTTYVGQLVCQQLGIGTDWSQLQGNQDHLAWYIDALGALFEPTASIVIDQGDDGQLVDGNYPYQTGYGSVFTLFPRFEGDTAICPTAQLPYLGQYVGVVVTGDVDDATARSLIAAEQGMQRGKASAILAAAQRFCTEPVDMIERRRPDGTNSGYWFLLYTDTGSVMDPTALTEAVNAVKPAGVMWALIESGGTPWDTDSRVWSANTTSWSSN